MYKADTDARLRELLAKATTGPWEVDSEQDRDGPDRHRYYKMFGPDGKALFDSLNTEVAYLHEEYDGDETGSWSDVWDEQGRVNFELIAAAVNALPSLLDRIEALEAGLRPFAEMAKWIDNTERRRDAIYCGGSPGLKCEIKQSDYRAARALLKGTGE